MAFAALTWTLEAGPTTVGVPLISQLELIDKPGGKPVAEQLCIEPPLLIALAKKGVFTVAVNEVCE